MNLLATIYMSSPRGIYRGLSCKPAEKYPVHVSGMLPRSLVASF